MEVATLLERATSTGPSSSPMTLPSMEAPPKLSDKRQAMLQRRREHQSKMETTAEHRERTIQMRQEKERLIRDLVKVVEVDPELLLGDTRHRSRRSTNSGLEMMYEDGDPSDEGPSEDEQGELDKGVAGVQVSCSSAGRFYSSGKAETAGHTIQ